MAGELFPDGSRYYLGTTYDSDVTVSAITNADPGVATSTGHGFTDGDFLMIATPWAAIDGMTIRVEDKDVNTFKIGGVDTTDTQIFPTSSNSATVKKVTAWTEIPKIMSSESSGGEQQYFQWQYLAERIQRQKPTFKNAKSLTMSVAYFPELSHYAALIKADTLGTPHTIRVVLPSKDELLYSMYIGFDKQPTQTQGQLMANGLALALAAPDFMYYKALA